MTRASTARTGGPRNARWIAPSVLLATRRVAAGKRPRAVRELEHQHAVVLAGGPQRPGLLVAMHLRRAPVGAAGYPVVPERMVRSGRWRRRARRVVVGDLFRMQDVANVEHAN